MNYRSRALLDLAYEVECTLRIPATCEGGFGEPCHANHEAWGKGGAMKAHDFAFASGCRACHRELDQGRTLTKEQRAFYWLRGHVETMRQLWVRGLIEVAGQPTAADMALVDSIVRDPLASKCHDTARQEVATQVAKRGKKRRGSQCVAGSKTFPRQGLA